MVTLVIVENSTDAPKKETFHVITAAKLMESDIWAVVLGKDCHNICKAVSTISGVKKVIKIDAEFLKEKLSESYAFQISNLLKAYPTPPRLTPQPGPAAAGLGSGSPTRAGSSPWQ